MLVRQKPIPVEHLSIHTPGKPYWKGRLNTVKLVVLTSLDQMLLVLEFLFTFFTKQATIMRSIVLSLPIQLVFPAHTNVDYQLYFQTLD